MTLGMHLYTFYHLNLDFFIVICTGSQFIKRNTKWASHQRLFIRVCDHVYMVRTLWVLAWLWYNVYMFCVNHEVNGWGTGGQWDYYNSTRTVMAGHVTETWYLILMLWLKRNVCRQVLVLCINAVAGNLGSTHNPHLVYWHWVGFWSTCLLADNSNYDEVSLCRTYGMQCICAPLLGVAAFVDPENSRLEFRWLQWCFVIIVKSLLFCKFGVHVSCVVLSWI